MSPPVIMHVNYCEQGQTIDEMCRKAAAWGFAGIEFRCRRRGVDETQEAYLDEIAAAVARSGLKQVIFGGPGPDLMHASAAVREQELAQSLRFYELAADRFPLTVCNVMSGHLRHPDPAVPAREYDRHGSAAATPEQWEWAAAGFKELGLLAARRGFRLAFETHPNYLHDTVPATARLVAAVGSPAVGINLDYGNLVYFNEPPALRDVIAAHHASIYLVHLKNSIGVRGAGRFPVGLADGEINNREFLALLKEHGYQGPLCIEAPRPGDREWFAQEDLAYITFLLAGLGW